MVDQPASKEKAVMHLNPILFRHAETFDFTHIPPDPSPNVLPMVLRNSDLSILLVIVVRGFNWLRVSTAVLEQSLRKVQIDINSSFNVCFWTKLALCAAIQSKC